MKRLILAGLLALVCAASAPAQGGAVERLRSPGGAVEVVFMLDEGRPVYAVTYGRKTVVTWSSLGLELRQGGALSRGVEVAGVVRRSHDATYRLFAGKASAARDRYRELAVTLRERGGARRTLLIVFRAYDDGAAFRYVVPAQAGLGRFDIVEERSEFRLPADHPCWAMQLRTFHSNYEKEFDRISVGQIKPGARVGLPLTIRPEGGPTLAIAEAGLKDYAGMYLQGLEGAPNALVSRLSPHSDGDGLAVSGRAPLATPWRVLLV
ncbi:MAG TPA: glycoside hydrolase family 97 N-terminal domain-containing protein, partial [Pyrinomonadaceae bacterium]